MRTDQTKAPTRNAEDAWCRKCGFETWHKPVKLGTRTVTLSDGTKTRITSVGLDCLRCASFEGSAGK